ncbi:hypothetical protein BS47DRAFT_1339458 [Hydnum rufescens UP504]|uniref:Uncharacterized protein n=1 Tax=Hydnum rufescens UP504 TaxID=1448309 RepID=A0A9P6B4J6_9AGAM|nr:hypothetical protein BS47DRAFT_1339458 [Hydnum rufescens UP504]
MMVSDPKSVESFTHGHHRSFNSPNGARLQASPLCNGQGGVVKSKHVHFDRCGSLSDDHLRPGRSRLGIYAMFRYSSLIATLVSHSLPLSSSAQAFSLTNNGSIALTFG